MEKDWTLAHPLCAMSFYKKSLKEVIVDTDDFQISAIETHLSLRFETFCLETSHKRRWKAVFEKINMVR